MTLRTVLLSVQQLLTAAEPDDPQDAVVARQYKTDPALFAKTAREWTAQYAGGAPKLPPAEQEKLDTCVAMGFSEAQARAALAARSWNLAEAIDQLCG
jgi:ubiquitin-conjugating enzyme (huntingtin interacting protein 2)